MRQSTWIGLTSQHQIYPLAHLVFARYANEHRRRKTGAPRVALVWGQASPTYVQHLPSYVPPCQVCMVSASGRKKLKHAMNIAILVKPVKTLTILALSLNREIQKVPGRICSLAQVSWSARKVDLLLSLA